MFADDEDMEQEVTDDGKGALNKLGFISLTKSNGFGVAHPIPTP